MNALHSPAHRQHVGHCGMLLYYWISMGSVHRCPHFWSSFDHCILGEMQNQHGMTFYSSLKPRYIRPVSLLDLQNSSRDVQVQLNFLFLAEQLLGAPAND